jgi:peptidyl-prolyl cis-trans isomerase C
VTSSFDQKGIHALTSEPKDEANIFMEGMMLKVRGIFFWISILLLMVPLGCGKPGEKRLGNNELVRVNDVAISLEEFRQMSEQQPLEGKMRLLNEKGLRDYLDNYVINREVLYQEAKQKGLDKNKEIEMKVEDLRKAMVIDALLEQALKGKSEVSNNEIQKYYQENKARFTEPLEIKIRHIVVNSESSLKEVLKRLAEGGSFEKIASLNNVDKSRENGGNLGFIRRGQLAPTFAQFEEVAFSLQKRGDTSEVVKTPLGYHIIQLLETQGTALKPFNAVKEKIRFFLQAKKKQEAYLEYIKEARSRAKIMINEKLWAEEEKREEKSIEGKK